MLMLSHLLCVHPFFLFPWPCPRDPTVTLLLCSTKVARSPLRFLSKVWPAVFHPPFFPVAPARFPLDKHISLDDTFLSEVPASSPPFFFSQMGHVRLFPSPPKRERVRLSRLSCAVDVMFLRHYFSHPSTSPLHSLTTNRFTPRSRFWLFSE